MSLRAFLVALLFVSGTASSAELPPLGDQATKWAASVPRGAIATADKRDGRWNFALAGQPFPPGRAEIPPAQVIFEIGSISKVFTGILLAHAVVEGKLSLDDTLARRLPAAFERGTAGTPVTPGTSATTSAAPGTVTLRQLATHTSCLPRLPDNMMHATGDDPYAQYDRKALFEYLAGAKLPAPPCAADYSNLGFGILGVVLEVAYDKPWATLVQERIAGPLAMTDTVQVLSPAQQSRFAQPWAGAVEAQPWTFKAIAGARALRSTLADMSRFADALLAGARGPFGKVWPLLAGDYADVPSLGGKVGLALMHAQSGGVDSYWHEGGTGGFRSVIQVYPADGRAAIVLASNNAANPSRWLAQWEAGSRPVAARPELMLPTDALDEYAGVYPVDKTARFTFIRRGDGLMARLTGQPFFPIYASAKDEFFYKVVDAQLSFKRDGAGRITGLTLHQNGRDIPAPRSAEPVPRYQFPGAAVLDEYRGEYDFGEFKPGATISVRGSGELLLVTLTGQPAFPVFAIAQDRFEYDVVKATLSFERDNAGKVAAVVLNQNGKDMRAPRR